MNSRIINGAFVGLYFQHGQFWYRIDGLQTVKWRRAEGADMCLGASFVRVKERGAGGGVRAMPMPHLASAQPLWERRLTAHLQGAPRGTGPSPRAEQASARTRLLASSSSSLRPAPLGSI
jgi:hypothetical protein